MIHLPFAKKEKWWQADDWLLSAFDKKNVLVFGPKGTGKDLLFSHIIALRNAPHYSLIPYNRKTELITMADLSLAPNTFENLIKGIYYKVDRKFNENQDVFLPELGMWLPSQYNKELDAMYPSFPLFYAGSRHYYNMNIHGNSQDLDRPWNKLREQADGYIRTLATEDCYDLLKVHCIYYSRYNDANNMYLPNSEEDALRRGISEHIVHIPITEIMYDTRYLKSLFFDIEKISYPIQKFIT